MISVNNVAPAVRLLPIFPRDHHKRRRLFVEDSFQHSSKSNLGQLAWIIRNFTAADDIILDPMGGMGSTLLGATMQRSVLVGEIEGYWLSILKRNRERISGSWLFTSPMLVYQGDAMNLPFRSGTISAIVTSPPYWDTFSDWNISSGIQGRHPGPYGSAFGDDRGQATKRNIGNIHIYEDYLRAMARVYQEAHRVLKNQAAMVLILKDRIHKQSRVPIVDDTIALCVAIGFSFERYDIPTRPSHLRALYRQQNPDGPQITSESIIVMQKRPPAGPGRRISIVEGIGPKGESCTGQAIDSFFINPVFQKILAYAQIQADVLYVLVAKQGFITLEQGIIDFDPELQRAKAKIRRE